VHSIVLIKQVPETSNVRLDPDTGTMVREGVQSIINPHDLYGIEIALQLREAHGGRVTVLSLGPRRAEREVREAVAMGCDDGILLSNRAFAGSDTWATSYALGRAVAGIGDADLIVCGVRATDGETGQVGPGIAALLDLPVATYVSRIVELNAGRITAERLIEEGYETVRMPLPAVITVVKQISYPRLPTLSGKQRARRSEVPIRGPEDIGADPALIGLTGSPTRVVKIEKPRAAREGTVLDAGKLGAGAAAAQLAAFIRERAAADGNDETSSHHGGHGEHGERRRGGTEKGRTGEEGPENRVPGMNARVWTLAEQTAGRLKPVSFELLAWGRRLAEQLDTGLASIVLGDCLHEGDLWELIERGADIVYRAEAPALAHSPVEPYTAILQDLVETEKAGKPDIFIAAATTFGRTLMPCLAIRLHTGLTADCTGLDIEHGTDNLLQTRPAIGGNVMATIKTADHRPQMATVRPRSLPPPGREPGRTGEIVGLDVPPDSLRNRVEHVAFRSTVQDDADIQEADIVVSGGRGLKRPENFRIVRELAAALGAAVGASRDAVDRGWISYPHQVGLSGKTVTPRLYIALGISGAIQHLAGMKTAETIVAVNSDPSAQIFQVADFGVVGDLFEIVPALIDELKNAERH